jgi:hypothetical protein
MIRLYRQAMKRWSRAVSPAITPTLLHQYRSMK